jgi:hypothetical protein
MLNKNLQESKSWNDYINGKLNLDENKFYTEGFPKYTYSEYNPLKFQLVLSNGNIKTNVTVDDSQQFMAEGRQWRDAKANLIQDYWVVAWREMIC